MAEQAAQRRGVGTARLDLVLWDEATVRAIREGSRHPDWHPDFPREDDRGAATLWRDGDPWGPRSIVHEGVVVGSIGFFGPPEDAADGTPEVEVGYGLVTSSRGLGLATEALAALLRRADSAGVRVRASIAPDNAASLRVAAKAGFTGVRGTTEDGEMVLVRPVR
ncbi:GNAT family N-acetyltransferase [Nocardioides sp. W3-2-3]|uniref:GNAT family N-acetyltransferase n=1 Tax=Nocardioides convexus TaxID=2712224 RepID=UPI0024188E6C|nr:GNAT family protein [Nocardioides convexus]NHA01463.1 GNAT family N-acetyltransferase [Nocardioides convexus]